MRHGQTVFNERNIVQGFCDSPLTAFGRHQALYAKRWFEDRSIEFDHAYASTQERASDTLELITDLPYVRLKAIKEMNFGLFEGVSNQLMRAVGNLLENPNVMVPFGGENMYAVQDRVVTALTEVMEKDDHQTVLAVSHGCTAFTFAHKWASDLDWEKIHLTNCCILIFTYENKTFEWVETVSHDFDQSLT